jgi:hypothetical protein
VSVLGVSEVPWKGQGEIRSGDYTVHYSGGEWAETMLANDGRCTCEIKSRIIMAKAAFNKKKTLFTSTLDLNLRKKLVKCYIWTIALYGAETWTLRKVGQKYLESFEMWWWMRMGKISWTDRVRNEEVVLSVNEQRNIEYPT